MQLIEMHRMVMHVQYGLHDITNHTGVGRDHDTPCVLDRPYRGKRVDGSTYAANTAYESPYIPGIPVFYDILDAPHHGTRAIGVLDSATFYFSLYPQVAFYTGNGVYDNSF